jgi:hypothetical protein
MYFPRKNGHEKRLDWLIHFGLFDKQKVSSFSCCWGLESVEVHLRDPNTSDHALAFLFRGVVAFGRMERRGGPSGLQELERIILG